MQENSKQGTAEAGDAGNAGGAEMRQGSISG